MARLMPGAGSYLCKLPPAGVSTVAPGLDLPPQKAVRRTAATFSTQEGGLSPAETTDLVFVAHNPSPRLRFSISVGFEYTVIQRPGVSAAGGTWQMQAIRIPWAGGYVADLDYLFVNGSGVATARAIPDAYEVDSAAKDLRGIITVPRTAAGANIDGTCALVVEARWEPHDGVFATDVLKLMAEADLYMVGLPPEFDTLT